MKWQKHVEFAAIPIVLIVMGALFVLFAAADTGLWAWLLVGAVGLVLSALLALWLARRHRHPAASEARQVASAPRDPSVYRVLVVADGGCPAETLSDAVSEHAAGKKIEVFVVAPALGSRLDRWTGDQSAYDAAKRNLDETLQRLEGIGVTAHGKIGSHDPIQAADDGLREFAADEIVLAVHTGSDANWLEEGIVDLARDRYDIPVTPVVVGTG